MDSLAATLLVIILPGIISAVIADKLISHQKWTSFKYALYAFLLGMCSYTLAQILCWAKNIFECYNSPTCFVSLSSTDIKWEYLQTWSATLAEKPSIIPSELIFALFLSLAIALFAAWLINHKIFNKIGKKLGVSNKFGDENLYSYYLNAQGIDWIYVRDIDKNLTYQGRVVAYSETETIQELVLSDVGVYEYQTSRHLYDIPSIYLTKEMGKFIIESVPFELLEEE